MSASSSWLPDLVKQVDGQPWDDYENIVFGHFEADFLVDPPRIKGMDFHLKRHPEVAGRHATFWHLLTSGLGPEATRTIKLERCERIRWPRAMIEKIGTPEICAWKEKLSGEYRVHLALPDFSYITVLALRSRYCLLWTAFDVERQRQRDRYKAKWLKFKKPT